MWWERVAKKQIHQLFIREETERRREETTMGNFYHACLYALTMCPTHRTEQMGAVNRLKAKIVKVYSARLSRETVEKHN
jgi:hypothetical protein